MRLWPSLVLVGSRRWKKIGEDVQLRRELDVFRVAHSGHLPPLPPWKQLLLCGHDPRWKKFGWEEPKGDDEIMQHHAAATVHPVDHTA